MTARSMVRTFSLVSLLVATSVRAADPPPLADYLKAESARLASRPLAGIDSADAWKKARPELQRQALEMLGLWPLPARGDLHAKVTGTVEKPDFVVEKVLYQSIPGLYVTGNLYRPKAVFGPLPAILYVCGHGKVEKDGVIYGNKAHYQHHAAWYAANGYVCLVLDTLQLGELPGLHHGTIREGMWWWLSRGYTPAGVEAWNGVRGIDYLISRPEVDKSRIGVTGRSGGGATSWWLGAIDDRIAAVAPVAGITDLQNHVVDGVVEGHCDCMYYVNTYRWDFPTLAALVAPKPMLVENTNKDTIFPEDGVRRVYRQLEKVYGWYGASDRVGLVIGQGGHADTVELRHPSFAFFEKYLKNRADATIEEPDRKVAIEDLKVLKPGEVPPGNANNTIHETFVSMAETPVVPSSAEAWRSLRAKWLQDLRTRVFGGWPKEEDRDLPSDAAVAVDVSAQSVQCRTYDFTSQEGIKLRLWLFSSEGFTTIHKLTVLVEDEGSWASKLYREAVVSLLEGKTSLPGELTKELKRVREAVEHDRGLAVVCPRGIGPSAWDPKRETHLRRRFALLGQTLDGQRVWDVRRALAVLRSLPETKEVPVELVGRREAASWALLAALFEPTVESITLIDPPTTVRKGPAYLNLERVLGMPQALALLYPRAVTVETSDTQAWKWAAELAGKIGPAAKSWPTIELPVAADSAQPGR